MQVVLVVGDRPERATALAQSLGILGIEAIASDMDWRLALRSLVAHDVALTVLDVDASERAKNFFELLKDYTDAPTLVRGPASDTALVVSYLERGAHDFVSMTTPPEVLAAKIQSVRRMHATNSSAGGIVVAGDVAIDLDGRLVTKRGIEIALTQLEFKLLAMLSERVGRACTREELLRRVWGADFASCHHYLRLYVGYLRHKLEDDPHNPRLIVNVWGYGYRLNQRAPETVSSRKSNKLGVALPA